MLRCHAAEILVNGRAVDEHAPLTRRVEAEHDVDERGLARAAPADEGDRDPPAGMASSTPLEDGAVPPG